MSTPKEIYLVDLGEEIVWSDDPDPENVGAELSEPVKYIRADIVEELKKSSDDRLDKWQNSECYLEQASNTLKKYGAVK